MTTHLAEVRGRARGLHSIRAMQRCNDGTRAKRLLRGDTAKAPRRSCSLAVVACLIATPAIGCHPLGSFEWWHTMRARERAALGAKGGERAAPLVATAQTVIVEGWPWLFTRQQVRQLRAAGCTFNKQDLVWGQRMASRRFTAEHFAQAYRDVRRYAGGDRRELERIASYRAAGFDLSNYGKYRRTRLSLTDYYNERLVGGHTNESAGWTFAAAGAAVLVFAGISVWKERANTRECLRRDEEDVDCSEPFGGDGLFKGVFFSLGSIFLAVGLPLGIVGSVKRARWVDGALLDEGDTDVLGDFRRWRRLRRQGTSRPRLGVAPLFTRGGGGLTLQLRF